MLAFSEASSSEVGRKFSGCFAAVFLHSSRRKFVGQVNFHLVQTIGTVSPVSPNSSEAHQKNPTNDAISVMFMIFLMWQTSIKLHTNVAQYYLYIICLADASGIFCIQTFMEKAHRTATLWTRRIFKIVEMTRKATQEAPAPSLRSNWVYLRKKHRYPNWLMADLDLPWLLGKINEFVVILVVKLSASSQHALIYVSNFTSVCEAKSLEIN